MSYEIVKRQATQGLSHNGSCAFHNALSVLPEAGEFMLSRFKRIEENRGKIDLDEVHTWAFTCELLRGLKGVQRDDDIKAWRKRLSEDLEFSANRVSRIVKAAEALVWIENLSEKLLNTLGNRFSQRALYQFHKLDLEARKVYLSQLNINRSIASERGVLRFYDELKAQREREVLRELQSAAINLGRTPDQSAAINLGRTPEESSIAPDVPEVVDVTTTETATISPNDHYTAFAEHMNTLSGIAHEHWLRRIAEDFGLIMP